MKTRKLIEAQWKCGDSFFTKYSSCSFDRAAHNPSNLLNPLHPSIVPVAVDKCTRQSAPDISTWTTTSPPPRPGAKKAENGSRGKCKDNGKNKSKTKAKNNKKDDTATKPCLPRPKLPTIDLSVPGNTVVASTGHGTEAVYPRDAKTGRMIPIDLKEIGKASRFGDTRLGEGGKCSVFEVVLQTKETTACPACARNPKRARLPAHARGCFGLS